ncbi:tetratricopeptide repeat protein [Microvirga sp. STR05]|uniref:Regulator of microtubule dynamics protein 1 n=1 Tax=Hymenobacter duratus TaxID=2771356 RepID=A0ABR8JJ08_9BACT|nr:tetratricopeptide repeat protein [Hymenobacter duratus]MBD2716820.1 tetratricopeptide repeat protein [Hymenobacter duratus]MBR7951736.1 tetratricopeptide repeat protein [Microvirga sp. STR05]
MGRFFWLILLLAGLLAVPAEAQWRRPSKATPKLPTETPETALVAKLLREGQELQSQYKDSEALGKYEQALAQAPATYEALWRAAVLSVRIGARYTDETRKMAYFSAARLYASRALVVRAEGAEGNYAEALALANQATLLTARSRLLSYKEMKPYVFKAVAQRPDFADAWQLLGRWHYRVDHYNILERIFSRVFLGGMPSGASTRAAIEALSKAHELNPKRIEYAYDLARVYLNQGYNTQATAVLQDAVELTPVTAEELEISRRCRKMLVQLNRRLVKQVHRHMRNVD